LAPRVSAPAPADSLATAGDIVLAGASSPYDHLSPTSARPTVGALLAAARRTAAALVMPQPPEGRWRSQVGEPGGAGPLPRVRTTCLPPGGFIALPRRRHGQGVVYLASGEAHAVAVAPQGGLRAVRRLTPGRGWVWGAQHRCHLINTGSDPALVVHSD
jgi:hypothetical protein